MRMTPYSVYWKMPHVFCDEITFVTCRFNIKTGKTKFYQNFEKIVEIKRVWRYR